MREIRTSQACVSPASASNGALFIVGAPQTCGRETQMVKSVERAIDPEPARASWLLEQAINNLSLGLIIFDNKREVVFCNKRYMEIYRLSSEQTKPGTPTSELIQHRLNLGLKVLSKPDDY